MSCDLRFHRAAWKDRHRDGDGSASETSIHVAVMPLTTVITMYSANETANSSQQTDPLYFRNGLTFISFFTSLYSIF